MGGSQEGSDEVCGVDEGEVNGVSGLAHSRLRRELGLERNIASRITYLDDCMTWLRKGGEERLMLEECAGPVSEW